MLLWYEPALAWAMAKQRTVFILAVAMLVLALGVYTQVGKTFMPTMDEGRFLLKTEPMNQADPELMPWYE